MTAKNSRTSRIFYGYALEDDASGCARSCARRAARVAGAKSIHRPVVRAACRRTPLSYWGHPALPAEARVRGVRWRASRGDRLHLHLFRGKRSGAVGHRSLRRCGPLNAASFLKREICASPPVNRPSKGDVGQPDRDLVGYPSCGSAHVRGFGVVPSMHRPRTGGRACFSSVVSSRSRASIDRPPTTMVPRWIPLAASRRPFSGQAGPAE